MIVQRKQYGAISVLFVQIGLALYVIVVFLAQSPDGIVKPTVLKMQKIAYAKQTAISSIYGKQAESLAANFSSANLGSGASLATANFSINPELRTHIEDVVASKAVDYIEQKQASTELLALGNSLRGATHAKNTSNPAYAYILATISALALIFYTYHKNNKGFFENDLNLSLYTLGSIPRAPTFAL